MCSFVAKIFSGAMAAGTLWLMLANSNMLLPAGMVSRDAAKKGIAASTFANGPKPVTRLRAAAAATTTCGRAATVLSITTARSVPSLTSGDIFPAACKEGYPAAVLVAGEPKRLIRARVLQD